jgi:hypothetical protein
MKRPLQIFGVLLALTSTSLTGFAADHGDAPAAANEPTADITDLYAWMSNDTTKLNLVMGVDPNAGSSDTFSPAVVYVFSIASMSAFGQPQSGARIACKFIDGTNIECWLFGGSTDATVRTGNDYVVGDPSSPAGITSAGGGLRVFAGLRDDPFFLEYNGFNATVNAAVAAVKANAVTFDEEKCPLLTPPQQTALVGQLQHGLDGAAPSNFFAGQNVLALVIQIDKRLVTTGGPILGVWAATHSAS